MALDSTQLEALKDQLGLEQAELKRLLSLIAQASKPVELDQNKVGRLSRMDAMQAQALAQEGARRQQHRLELIEGAMARIDRTDYGRCLECDEWIPYGRLRIDPIVEHCVVCAAHNEKGD